MKRIAINGLGRIGRLVLRCYMDAKPEDFEIVALNDLTPPSEMAYLIKYDSIHRKAGFSVEAAEGALVLDGKSVPFSAKRTPQNFPGKNWAWI